MANGNQNPNQNQAAKTNAAEVRKQNAASQGQGAFGTEFASETNATKVKATNN
jgi:small acid-soluble spore protein E (minor gamma-type SASP)